MQHSESRQGGACDSECNAPVGEFGVTLSRMVGFGCRVLGAKWLSTGCWGIGTGQHIGAVVRSRIATTTTANSHMLW